MMHSARRTLRTRLAQAQPLVVPGCFDTMSALLIQAAGFEAVLVSGFGVAASLLGVPDVEIYTEPEMVGVCRNVCRRMQVPVLADADNGYGNALNVMRTVADLEDAGVASITLEDQTSPKKCPLISGTSDLVSIPEATGKLRAALAARRDPELMIVARTDARGEEEVLQRARAYAEAGVDAIKIISPALRRVEFVREVKAACGLPVFISSLGWAAGVDPAAFHGLASVITHPLMPLATAAAALRANLDALRAGEGLPIARMSQHDIEVLLGMDQVRAHEAAFLPA